MAAKPADSYTASVQTDSKNQSIAILTTDEVQDLEFFYPYYRFIEAGYHVDVVTPKGKEFKGKHDMGLKETLAIKDVHPEQYALLYIPGGGAPEKLKDSEQVIEWVRNFVQTGKPVAAICHGPQVLAAADVIKGRTIAAWPKVEKEVEKAGATYADEPTVVDGQFITARWPGDLPSHLKRTLEILESGAESQSQRSPRTAARI